MERFPPTIRILDRPCHLIVIHLISDRLGRRDDVWRGTWDMIQDVHQAE